MAIQGRTDFPVDFVSHSAAKTATGYHELLVGFNL
jgi:hypothetical protein